MNENVIIEEITGNLNFLSKTKLKEVLNFVKYIRYQKELDPTLEILDDSDFSEKVETGIKEKEAGEVLNWEDVK